MKKLLCAVASIILLVGVVVAGVDDVNFGGSVANTAAITNNVVVRGDIGGVLVTLPSAMTCTVAITSSEGTIFSKTVGGAAGNTYYSLRYPMYGSTGVALGYTDSTGTTTNSVYGPLSVAGKVTAVITGSTPASGTNAVVVRLNVIK